MATRRVQLGPTGQTVRENIARVRREQRMTLRDVADHMATTNRPMAHNTISEIERGARRVDVDDLMALAIALDISPTSLLTPWHDDGDIEVNASGTQPVSLRNLTSFLEGMRSLRGTDVTFAMRCAWPWLAVAREPTRLRRHKDTWVGKLMDSDGETVQYRTSVGLGSALERIEKLENGDD